MDRQSSSLSLAGVFLAALLFALALWAGTYIPIDSLVSGSNRLAVEKQLAQVGGGPTTVVLSAAADAAVRGGNFQTINYGSGNELGIYQAGGQWDIQPYLRFDLSNISGNVTAARLRFYIVNGDDSSSPRPVSLLAVDDNSWDETSLNWQNRPSTGSALGSFAFGSETSTFTGWQDVTNYVSGKVAAGAASFALRHSAGGEYAGIASRESGQPAELEVTYDSTVVTPPTTRTLATTANPSAGGTISRQPNQTNYPDGSVVTLTATPNPGYQFNNWSGDLSGSQNPVSVQLTQDKTVTANFGVTSPSGGNSGYDLTWSTYFGGSGEDTVRDVVVDAGGNVYVTGGTGSSNFPLVNPAQPAFGGNHDVFVSKFGANGALLWSTYLGGPGYDRAYAVELDGVGNVYVAGRAGSGFPVTSGVLQATFAGDSNVNNNYGPQDGFVAKFNSNGQKLWATYLGGPDRSFIRDIDVDSSGNVYAVLTDVSQSNGYQTTGAYQGTVAGGANGFIAKLNSAGTQIQWGTYVGGASSGPGFGTPSIRVASNGEVVAMGTSAFAGDPVSNGLRSHAGALDMYVLRLSSDGRTRRWSTYLGGNADEFSETHSLALNSAGDVYAAFTTRSSNLPGAGVGYQLALGGVSNTGNYNGDGFVAKLSGNGGVLLAATYLGGSSGDGLEGVGVDSAGGVYVSGGTFSADFPITSDARQNSRRGEADWFVSKLTGDLSSLVYSTYLGGTSNCAAAGDTVCDYARSATVNAGGDFYVVGHTNSSNFPTLGATPSLSTNPAGSNVNTGAIAKFSTGGVVVPPTDYTITASVSGGNGTINPSGVVTVSAGGSRTFTFSPATGFQVGTVVVDGATLTPPPPTYTFSNVSSAHTITISFSPVAPTTRTLATTANPSAGGTISRQPNQTNYPDGSVVTLTATPNPGYQFNNWSGDLSGSQNPVSVQLTQDKTVTANFGVVQAVQPLLLRLEFDDDNADGVATDSSSFGNNGTCVGAVCPRYLSAGSEDGSGAYDWDGTNDVLALPDSPSLRPTTNLSIATWVRFSSLSAAQAIVNRWSTNGFAWSFATHWQNPREFYLALDGDGTAPADYFAISAGANLQPNTWYHLAATFDGNSVILYKNGQPLPTTVSGTRPVRLHTGPSTPLVGSIGGTSFLNGRLDRTRIFDSALTPSEIAVLAQVSNQTGDVTPPVVAVTAPVSGVTLSGVVNFAATAADVGGSIAGVRFLLDGIALGQEITTAPYATIWDSATVANGPHQLVAEARDAAGNLSTSAPVNFVVNNQAVGAITINLTALPASGAAPLAVFFDASGTTYGGSAIRPFHDLDYRWDFGDPASGVWDTNGQSRNAGRGPLNAHVFERPGTYTVTLSVSDGQGQVATRQSIVNVNVPTSGTCYSTTGNFSGCPTGFQQVTTSQVAGNGLYRRGETFTRVGNLSNVSLLGAFGTGPRPRLVFTSAPSAVSASNNALIHGVAIDGGGYAIQAGGLGTEHLFVVDNEIKNFYNYGLYKGPFSLGPEVASRYNAVMGNWFDTASSNEHAIRTYIAKSYIGHNRIDGNYPRGTNIKFVGTLCADGSNDYNLIADNYFNHREPQAGMLAIGAGDAGHINCSKDLIIERNYFDNKIDGWPKAAMGAGTRFDRVTIRNNIAREMSHFISNTGETGASYSDWRIYNNLFYNTNLFPSGYYFLLSKGSMPGLEVRNNIVQTFGGSVRAGLELQKDAPATVTETNNIWYGDFNPLFRIGGTNYSFAQWQALGKGAGSLIQNPFLTSPGNGDFSLTAASPAIDQGFSLRSVANDFLGNYRPHDGNNSGTAEWDIGPYEFGSSGGGNPNPPTTTYYTITVNAGANGTVNPGTATVAAGSSQSFTITPNGGYQIANVLVDGQSMGPITTHTFSGVQANHNLTAAFSPFVPSDTTPPIISNVRATNISQTGALITWQTDEPARSFAEYGFTTAYGQQTVNTTVLATNHAANLNNLSPGVVYHYRAVSIDALGNLSRSINFVFQTLPSPVPDTTPPGAIQGLTAVIGGAGLTSYLVSWAAPAQDGNVASSGAVANYDLRYSLQNITEANWSSAVAVTGEPPPGIPGASQDYTLVGLTSGTTYYAALKSTDVANNLSPLSNVISFRTLSDPPPGPVIPGGGPGGPHDARPPVFALQAEITPGPGQAVLTWTKPTDANYVRTLIVRSANPLTASAASTQNPERLTGTTVVYEGADQSFTDTGLTNGRTYYYAIYAYDQRRQFNRPQILSTKPLAGSTNQQNDPTTARVATTNSFSVTDSCRVESVVTAPVSLVRGPFGVGLTSPEVRLLQAMLATDSTLYPEGVVDGYYGPAVVRAIQRFQAREGLVRAGTPETTGYGLAGPQTRAALNRVLGVPKTVTRTVCSSGAVSTADGIGNSVSNPTNTVGGDLNNSSNLAALLIRLRLILRLLLERLGAFIFGWW